MKHFLANEWNRAHTRRRGAGQPILLLDEAAAEQRYRLEPADTMTPERLYERGWAFEQEERARQAPAFCNPFEYELTDQAE